MTDLIMCQKLINDRAKLVNNIRRLFLWQKPGDSHIAVSVELIGMRVFFFDVESKKYFELSA